MAKRITPLTAAKIRTVKTTEKPQKLFDGGGLFLLVTPSGGKLWRFKYRFEEKKRYLFLAHPLTLRSVEIAWSAQVRLCGRFRKLLARGKNRNTVVTAITRELSAFMWAIARTAIPAGQN